MISPVRRLSHVSTVSRAATLALLLALAAGSASAQKTYVAVGDSLAYGFMDPVKTPLGTGGAPGYTQPYDAFLSAQAKAPITLVDLGIVGETTDSLLHNAVGNSALNSNYSAASPTSQYDLLSSTLNGNVSNVTVQIGGNDILGLASDPAFQDAFVDGDSATVQKLLTDTLTQIGANYDTLLTRIDALAPGADVQALGYYNPYAFLPPATLASPYNDYLRAVSVPLEQGLNGVIAQEAALHHAQYVDLAPAFDAHGSDYDQYVLTDEPLQTAFGPLPNDHPTALGYSLITQQLEAPAAVPETSTVVSFGLLLALGLGGLAVTARRKKARA